MGFGKASNTLKQQFRKQRGRCSVCKTSLCVPNSSTPNRLIFRRCSITFGIYCLGCYNPTSQVDPRAVFQNWDWTPVESSKEGFEWVETLKYIPFISADYIQIREVRARLALLDQLRSNILLLTSFYQSRAGVMSSRVSRVSSLCPSRCPRELHQLSQLPTETVSGTGAYGIGAQGAEGDGLFSDSSRVPFPLTTSSKSEIDKCVSLTCGTRVCVFSNAGCSSIEDDGGASHPKTPSSSESSNVWEVLTSDISAHLPSRHCTDLFIEDMLSLDIPTHWWSQEQGRDKKYTFMDLRLIATEDELNPKTMLEKLITSLTWVFNRVSVGFQKVREVFDDAEMCLPNQFNSVGIEVERGLKMATFRPKLMSQMSQNGDVDVPKPPNDTQKTPKKPKPTSQFGTFLSSDSIPTPRTSQSISSLDSSIVTSMGSFGAFEATNGAQKGVLGVFEDVIGHWMGHFGDCVGCRVALEGFLEALTEK